MEKLRYNIMKTTINKIHEISRFIRSNGTLINKANSSYGADRWELGLLANTLEDDGYTTCIHSQNLGLRIADCCGRIEVRKGNIEDLDVLYNTLFKKEDE